jgi:hypothetical protein
LHVAVRLLTALADAKQKNASSRITWCGDSRLR